MSEVFIKEVIENFSKYKIHRLKLIYNGILIELEKDSISPYDLYNLSNEKASLDPFNLEVTTKNINVNTGDVKNEIKEDIEVVKSPIVGTYYSSSSPGLKPFVEVGAMVLKGQTICIIEAMKVMNEIKAPCEGMIHEIYISDGNIVEYDLPILSIRKTEVLND